MCPSISSCNCYVPIHLFLHRLCAHPPIFVPFMYPPISYCTFHVPTHLLLYISCTHASLIVHFMCPPISYCTFHVPSHLLLYLSCTHPSFIVPFMCPPISVSTVALTFSSMNGSHLKIHNTTTHPFDWAFSIKLFYPYMSRLSEGGVNIISVMSFTFSLLQSVIFILFS